MEACGRLNFVTLLHLISPLTQQQGGGRRRTPPSVYPFVLLPHLVVSVFTL